MSDQLNLSPESLYERLSTPRLLTGFYLPDRLYEMQLYLMLLNRCALPLPNSVQDWQRKARELDYPDLERLYRRCHDDFLVQLMIMIKIHWKLMQRELYKRFGHSPTGLDILMEKWENVQRRWIRTRRTNASPSPEDTIQDGMKRGLELLEAVRAQSLDEEEHKQFLELPAPAFPFPLLMDEFERRAWDWLVADMWQPSLRASFTNVLPLIQGDLESSAGIVDNFLLELGRKPKRHNSILNGREKFPKDGPESWRAEWDFSKTAAQDRYQTIGREIHLNRFRDRSDMAEVLRKAQKKWGVKGVKALQAMFDGKTEEEAATLAGVSSKTVRNYKMKLSKEFSRNK